MKNRIRIFTNKKISIVVIFLFLIVVLYALNCFYVSISINAIIKQAMSDKPYSDNLKAVIDKEEYDDLNPRQFELEENVKVKRIFSNSFPIGLPWLTDVYYTYRYTVSNSNNDEVIYDDPNSHVTIKLDYSFFDYKIVEIVDI